MWPQLVLIVLVCLNLGIAIEQHGNSKKGTENAWTTVLAIVIQVAILWWGGFWNPLIGQ